uniref:Uncharacterized protein n=1 Tax=Rhizophora mucronata TaxID=61149 RepID=A0A2P2Q9X4_RHIMU
MSSSSPFLELSSGLKVLC